LERDEANMKTPCRDNPDVYQYRRADGCLVVDGPRTQREGLMPLSDMAEEDARRRLQALRPLLDGCNSWLDYGCGHGVEIGLARHSSLPLDRVDGWDAWMQDPEPSGAYDLVTLFHVVEHVDDGAALLARIRERYSPRVVIVETPNANDWMLACEAYRRHAAWTDHRCVYTADALRAMMPGAEVTFVQRYPLSNSLRWLIEGKPGGHLDEPWYGYGLDHQELLGDRTDTLWAVWRLA
jgi:hypothetical protein